MGCVPLIQLGQGSPDKHITVHCNTHLGTRSILTSMRMAAEHVCMACKSRSSARHTAPHCVTSASAALVQSWCTRTPDYQASPSGSAQCARLSGCPPGLGQTANLSASQHFRMANWPCKAYSIGSSTSCVGGGMPDRQQACSMCCQYTILGFSVLGIQLARQHGLRHSPFQRRLRWLVLAGLRFPHHAR